MSEVTVFVYGTLRRGGLNAHLMDAGTWQRTTKTAPLYSLWQLSWYPGMTMNGDTAVVGDVITLPIHAIAALDDYEGDTYRRMMVLLEDGTQAVAWVMRYPPIGKPAIQSGDWLQYLEGDTHCQTPAFSGMVSTHEHAGL